MMQFLNDHWNDILALNGAQWLLIAMLSVAVGTGLFSVFNWLYSQRFKAQSDVIDLQKQQLELYAGQRHAAELPAPKERTLPLYCPTSGRHISIRLWSTLRARWRLGGMGNKVPTASAQISDTFRTQGSFRRTFDSTNALRPRSAKNFGRSSRTGWSNAKGAPRRPSSSRREPGTSRIQYGVCGNYHVKNQRTRGATIDDMRGGGGRLTRGMKVTFDFARGAI